MPRKNEPFLGLGYGWDTGENGWGSGYNETVKLLALLASGGVETIQNEPVQSPVQGKAYIVGTTPTGLWAGKANHIAYWSVDITPNAWVFVPPKIGFEVLVKSQGDNGEPYCFGSKNVWVKTQASLYAEQAANSAAQAKASENAVETDRVEVATNTTTVNEKTPLAVAAADTASQKAVAAAASDASARDAATRAENAALAMTGAILDGGQCDLSSGFYPPALTVSGKKYSTVWYVQVGGTVAGTKYDAGDKLQYTTANDGFYFRIDARDDVVSVNGEKGAVVLTAQNVGADPIGTAASLVNNLKSDPNPFPQYSDFVSGEPRTFASRAQLAKRAAQYHPLDGQLVPRSSDAGLLAAIIAGDVPSCSDADWLADKSKRGMYTLGDGTTNIRLPDWNGKSAGAIGALVIRGDGSNAASAGVIQGDCIRNITGTWSSDLNGRAWLSGSGAGALTVEATSKPNTFRPDTGFSTVPFASGIKFDASLVVPTGPENRMVNTAGVHAVKR